MALSRKDCIALADMIRFTNGGSLGQIFTEDAIQALSVFCARGNPSFGRHRWISYIAGESERAV